MSFYYWQVSGKPPAAPSGPHDCEDVHVRVRPIRLSTAKREKLLPLPNLIQSTAHADNHRAHACDNKDNYNGGNHIDGNRGDDGQSGGGGVLTAAEVTLHNVSRCAVGDPSKPVC